MRSSAKDEVALRDALIGKNSVQAVKIIAAEFERRFEGKGRTAKDIIRALAPRGKAVSWIALDKNITDLCQGFSQMADMLDPIILVHKLLFRLFNRGQLISAIRN